eukprot:1918094-Rhodomonas_salina.3
MSRASNRFHKVWGFRWWSEMSRFRVFTAPNGHNHNEIPPRACSLCPQISLHLQLIRCMRHNDTPSSDFYGLKWG